MRCSSCAMGRRRLTGSGETTVADSISVDISRCRDAGAPADAASTEGRNTCPSCGSHYREDEMVAQPARVHPLRLPLPGDGPRADRAARPTRASWPRSPRDLRVGRSAGVRRLKAVSRAACRRRVRPPVCATRCWSERRPSATSGGAFGDGLHLPGRAAWASVVGEKFARAADARLAERMPLVSVVVLGRRAHAGGRAGTDADGQDGGGGRRAARGRAAVRLDSWRTRPPVAWPPALPPSAT